MKLPFQTPICFRPLSRATALLVATALFGCDNDPTAPQTTETGSITVDASASTAFIAFGETAETRTVADPATSALWDMSLFATGVSLNGGAAGPGGVSGYCLCQNAGADDAAIMAMTESNQLAAFESVTELNIPAEASFVTDDLIPVVGGWYVGTPGSGSVATGKTFILRRGSGSVTFAKLRILSVTSATPQTIGSITFEYAAQAEGSSSLGAPVTRTVDVGANAVAFNLTTGAVTTGADWDVRFQGYTIRTNGGVSGGGTVRGLSVENPVFAAVDAAFAQAIPASVYTSDRFGGVFATEPWYRYNITGIDNQIWPLFHVYLLKRGSAVYKVQLTGYYNLAGAPRHISVRYARLRS